MATSARTHRLETPEGVEIRTSAFGHQSIRIHFRHQGKRYRETLLIPVNAQNVKYAARRRAEILMEIDRGTFDYATAFPNSKVAAQLQENADITVGELLDLYIDTARKLCTLSPSTIASYVRWANARIKPQFGKRKASSLTPTEIRKWIVDKLAPELKTKSIRNCVGLLSAVLNRAAIETVIPRNVIKSVEMRTVLPKQSESDVDPFNDQEIKAVLASAPTIQERCLWQFAFATGLRTGELIALEWKHIDLDGDRFTATDNLVRGERGVVRKGTKTNVTTLLPLLPAAKAALLALPPGRRTGPVFQQPNKKARWCDDRQVRRYWVETLALAGVRYRRPYQTRHTFASKLLEQGESTTLVATLLQHSTIEMVIRTYGKYIKQGDVPRPKANYASFAAT